MMVTMIISNNNNISLTFTCPMLQREEYKKCSLWTPHRINILIR